MFQLRPYQIKFIEDIRTNLGKYKKIIACAATGSGKSKVFISIAQMAHAKGLTVLIITESSKIYEQITDELHAGNINASKKDSSILSGHIYIGMVQTLARRPKMLESFNNMADKLLIINDEAHVGTSTKLLQQLPTALLIGFTATPDWKAARHLPLIYNACIVGPQPDELVQSGHLVSYQHFARVLADLDDLKIKNGEFSEESQERVFESKKVYDGLISDLKNVAYRKALVFCASIKHCQEVSEQLGKAGILNIQIHSKRDKGEQSFDMARFKDVGSSINVVVSVGVLTKGWDYPPLDLVILNRATTSLPLYMQMIGRGSRTYNEKKVFTVLDYGGNYERHGLWDAEVDWQKKWKESKRKKKEGVAPIKMCPQCDYINPISISVCKNCGHVFEKQDTGPSDEETKLIEITAAYRNLIGLRVSELNPQQLALYAKFKNKKAFAIRVAKSKEQRLPGYLLQFAIFMGYKPGWTHYQSQQLTSEQISFTDIILR
jgi:superfamily II DNA or RNA helicase